MQQPHNAQIVGPGRIRKGADRLWGIAAGLAFCLWTLVLCVAAVGAIFLHVARALLAPAGAYGAYLLGEAAGRVGALKSRQLEIALAGQVEGQPLELQPRRTWWDAFRR